MEHTDSTPTLNDYRTLKDPMVQFIFSASVNELDELEKELIQRRAKLDNYLMILRLNREHIIRR